MTNEKKYALKQNDYIIVEGTRLFRVVALRNFCNVSKGDTGGYIESEANLAQEGNAWVGDDAKVYGNALVRDDAQVYGNALVRGVAKVCDNARVSGSSKVYDNAQVSGHAWVCRNAKVCDNAQVSGDAWVGDNALVGGIAQVCDYAKVHGNALVNGNAQVYGNARVYCAAQVSGDAMVFDAIHLKFGVLSTTPSLNDLLRCSLGVHPVNNKVRVYKRVNRDLSSEYDSSFKYPSNGTVTCNNYDPDSTKSCARGLHFATNEYWPSDKSYHVLVADVDLDDIICCLEGKIRVKAAYIVGVAG